MIRASRTGARWPDVDDLVGAIGKISDSDAEFASMAGKAS